jgi:hypothetical protein
VTCVRETARRGVGRAFTLSAFPAMLLVFSVPAIALAQVRMRGLVLDNVSRTPLASVNVSVDATDISVVTDKTGRFVLPPLAGTFKFRLRRIGYAPLERLIEVRASDTLVVEFLMTAQAQQLAPSVTEGQRDPRWPPGLAERMRDYPGTFITDSVLRKFDHTTLVEALLARTTHVKIGIESGRYLAFSRRGGMGLMPSNCYMSVWVDGILVWRPGLKTDQAPDLERFQVSGLEAVEVYTVGQMPPRYTGSDSGCGVLVIWTRQHLPAPPGT